MRGPYVGIARIWQLCNARCAWTGRWCVLHVLRGCALGACPAAAEAVPTLRWHSAFGKEARRCHQQERCGHMQLRVPPRLSVLRIMSRGAHSSMLLRAIASVLSTGYSTR